MGSRFPQNANDYESAGTLSPADKGKAKVWYYEERGRLQFHLDVFKGTVYQGHIAFSVQRSKLLASLKRMGNG